MRVNSFRPAWTLAAAFQLLPKLEFILKPHGWHCALGGSVLHRGWSDKDLDVFVYPHDSRKANRTDLVWKVLKEALEHTDSGECNASGGKQDRDLKEVKWMKNSDRRIDFFFLK